MKNKSKANKIVYEGMCSRFTDMVGKKSLSPAPEWEAHVLDKVMTILIFKRPDIVEQIKEAVEEHFDFAQDKRTLNHVDNEKGKVYRCYACNQRIE
jgi:hypothetical protein|tara:strand:- start:623 stop:910 length:288 start_codon:yes stop_codon:yes gene_type:complete